MSPDVFISYSSKDSLAATSVCHAIESSGFGCWIAPRNIVPGREWSEEIIDALNGCRAIVLIFSSHSNASPQVLREVERGVNKRIPILVFRIEDVPLSKAMEYFLSVPHWFDAVHPPLETHLESLTKAIAHLMGGEKPLVAAVPAPLPKPAPQLELPNEPTFLFTDIEGSTKLWEAHHETMQVTLPKHDQVMRDAIESHGGQVFKTIGDAFCAVFPRASEAVNAALKAQRGFAELTVNGQPIKVRMALHTGVAERRDNDFFGQTLNRVARLLAIGHGGQVLLSQATCDLLPSRDSLLDLGMHRLKDLQQPEHVWQVNHPELVAEFAPLRSLSLYDNNLPQQVTSFIGREKELAEIKDRIASVRLLTLTGSGGTGKTRLALQVAADVLDRFPEGVWLVEFAPLTDPSLVPQTVAEVLSIREVPGEPITKTLVTALKDRSLLLVLDNGEHLLEAVARLVDALLRGCPKTRLIISSREALGIAGESTYSVPSLSLPQPRKRYTPETLAQFESVRLFVERASAAKPDFGITAANVSVLAQVCHRLDGIPMAIELAAARIRSMPIEQLATRLDDRFRILTGGSRTALPRQQTLRAMIDWSYDLLEENQKALLCRLSVFAGGWTLEAAEGVCAGDIVEDWEMLDLLTALHDKSLVVYEESEGEARYRLLETIRQYSRDRLAESGEGEPFRDRHRDFFLTLAEEAGDQLTGPDQRQWFDRLELEHDNLRGALGWSGEQEGGGEAGLRLCSALWRFWYIRGYLGEGREHCRVALSHANAPEKTASRANSLKGSGVLAYMQGDYASARTFLDQALTVSRELGDKVGEAANLNNLGLVASEQGDYTAARELYEQSLALSRELGNQASEAANLGNLGLVAHSQADYAAARTFFEQALVLNRQLGGQVNEAIYLNGLGRVVQDQGDFAAARSFFEQALVLDREVGNQTGVVAHLGNLGDVAREQGDNASAQALYEEALALNRELGDRVNEAMNLNGLGLVANSQGAYEAAQVFFEQALVLNRETGNQAGEATNLGNLGDVADHLGDYTTARTFLEQALGLNREMGIRACEAYNLSNLGDVAAHQEEYPQARSLYMESMRLNQELGNKTGMLEMIVALAKLIVVEGEADRAARLWGAAEVLGEGKSTSLSPRDREEYKHHVALAQTALGDVAFATAWSEGRNLSLEQAVTLALAAPSANA